MQADSRIALADLRVDGGATRNNLLMQFQADLLGVSVVRAANTESTALGAALLAGLAVGFWKDAAAIEPLWRAERTFDAAMPRAQVTAITARWHKAVERAKGWAQ